MNRSLLFCTRKSIMRKEPWIKAFVDAPQMLARLTLLACHLHYNERHLMNLMKQRVNGKNKMTRKDAAHMWHG